MERVRVLVANRPTAYRGAIAEALRCLRPDAEVIDADPKAIRAAARRWRPHLVVGDDRSALEMSGARDWILLYADGERRVEICVAGRHTTAADLDFDDLLALVDEAGSAGADAPVAQTRRTSGGSVPSVGTALGTATAPASSGRGSLSHRQVRTRRPRLRHTASIGAGTADLPVQRRPPLDKVSQAPKGWPRGVPPTQPSGRTGCIIGWPFGLPQRFQSAWPSRRRVNSVENGSAGGTP